MDFLDNIGQEEDVIDDEDMNDALDEFID